MSLQNEPSSFHARTAEDRTWAKKEAGANCKIKTTNEFLFFLVIVI